MAENRSAFDAEATREERRRLLLRAGVALSVIVLMLGGLVLWERHARQAQAPQEAPRLATPEAIRAQLGQSAPSLDRAALEPPERGQSEALAASSEPLADPASLPELPPDMAAAELEFSAAPGPQASPPATTGFAPAPAASRAALVPRTPAPPSPVLTLAPIQTPTPAPTPAPSKTPPAVAAPAAPAARATPSVTAAPRLVVQAEAAPSGEVAPAGKAFAVQLGVFSNATNAEELHHKLAAAGIPSELETRVAVGPFKTRAEALAAQARMLKLGLGKGQLVTVKR